MNSVKKYQSANDTQELALQKQYMEKATSYVKKLEQQLGHKPLCCVTTFGCQMNARDSEKLAGILHQVGYEMTQEEEMADFVIYNTCTVRDNANQRV
ncbi:MAG: tRNA (N6-isopentenyl adenosine(37)-C2)-methylthiotransferase MiaB, partial [Lachnospiraceae bacterium]|nr:tRNA (N6-isopentenyl adenosine(37)-C2)-methylthiotransferase MiaB [Lachnospiraceae bacterium]